ncbi:sperm-associated microtubule inner protein 4 [Petaurus breviceps papuanus]|uniref:sperm-associated microtubule inner protein 4 n=1 Tax=Petaurus breviceps papuanus TaxID=3040969 RepID=UPI0036DEAE5F
MEVCHGLPHYYRQLEGTDILSNTVASNEIHTPLQIPPRITASQDRYQEFRQSNPVQRLPWGTEREYGAMVPISLPEEHRPKSEPPRFFGKGHKHFGFGGDPWPRGVPIQQFYHLTQNKKSDLYENDSLLPKSLHTAADPLCMGFPVGHPYQTHISRFAMFPSFTSPKDMNTGLVSSLQQPFPATMPTNPYETTVLRKAKGNPYRHENLDFPSDSRKKALQWPGQRMYYDIPKHIRKNTQIFYPKPPKLLAPNTTLTTLDPSFSLKESNMHRNLERSHWITSYTHDFTGSGPMNPLELDDFHEKEIATLTGQIGFDPPPQERSHPEFLPTRPLEGRIARILQGRRPRDAASIEQRLPSCPECTPSILCKVHSVVPSHAEMMLVKGSTPAGPVARKNQISEIEDIIRDRVMPPSPDASPPHCKTKDDAYNFSNIYEPNPYPKITDTYKNDVLYWRQLLIKPTSQMCVEPEDFLYYDYMKPSQLDQYIVWRNPVSLSKPSILPELADQKPPFSPCHRVISESQEHPQSPDTGSQEEKDPLLKWIPNAGVARPQTCLLELQDSFSKTGAQRRFQESVVQEHKDLRDNERLRMRHNFYNYNAYYFFN